MTRDTEKAFVIIYAEHLRRRSFGTAKNQAVQFEDAKLRKIEAFFKLESARYQLLHRPVGKLGICKAKYHR